MDMSYLNEMLGRDMEGFTLEYPLPSPNPDALDNSRNTMLYAAAKPVLECPEINPVLKDMDAFDTLSEYNVDTYYDMACWIVEALHEFSEESKDTPQEITFMENFVINPSGSELTPFGEEFLMEFSRARFSDTGDGEMGMDDMSVPDQSTSWIDKMAAKFGISNVGIKDFIYLYILNRFGDKLGKEKESKSLPVTESYNLMLNEKAPPGMEGWIRSLKEKFQKEYGDDWKEVLYSTAWKKYNEDNAEPVTEEEEVMKEDIDDIYGGATKQDHFPRPKDKKMSKPSAKVKKDMTQRIKELDKLIRDYKEKTHFFGEVKPAIFNAKEALEFIQDKLNDGSMESYKEAQIHFQKLMSPITNLFPPSLVKFLAHGGDGEESKGTPIES